MIKGSCNLCGECSCYTPTGRGKHFPCIADNYFGWDEQHPEWGLPIVKLIKKAVAEGKSKVGVPGVGEFDFTYVKGVGLGVSRDDYSCPFFNKETHLCALFNTEYMPKFCKERPQCLTKKQFEEWKEAYPSCSFYWKE